MAAEKVEFILQADDQASKKIKDVESSFSNLKAKSAEVGVAFSAIAVAGGVMIKSWITASQESARTGAQLNAVLKSTQNAAGLTAEEIKNMAGALAKTTTIEDDTIISGQNMLLTFTNIGKDAFPKATESMLDMATAMNGGMTPSAEQLKSTAIQLGKALNDPAKGISALTRNGVTFTEQQKEQIETMQKSGDMLGAQTLILAELSKEFGGSATEAAKTFSGQMENLNNRVGEIGETFGNALVPILQQVGGVLGQVVSYFEDLDEPTKNLIAQTALVVTAFAAIAGGAALLIAAISPLVITVGLITAAVGALYIAWQTNFLGIQDITKTVFDWLKTKFQELLDYIGPTVNNMVESFKKTWATLAPWIQQNWGTITQIFQFAFDLIKANWELFWAAIQLAFTVAWEFLSGSIKVGLAVLRGDWSGAWEGIKGIFVGIWEAMKAFFGVQIKVFLGLANNLWELVKGAFIAGAGLVTKEWNDLWNNLKAVVDQVVGAILGVINGLMNAISGAISAVKNLASAAGGAVAGAAGAAANFVTGGTKKASADGNNLNAGEASWVGERGPEIFVPNQSGTIVPNHKLGIGGGGTNVTININGPISSKEAAQEVAELIFDKFKFSGQAF